MRLVGIVGGDASPTTTSDLSFLAKSSGAVDSLGNPLVLPGADGAAPVSLQSASSELIAAPLLEVSIAIVDDPRDSVDVSVSFVERIETRQLGTPVWVGIGEGRHHGDCTRGDS